MKKRIFHLVLLVLVSTTISAQEFVKGTNVINAGIGLGGTFGSYATTSQSLGFSASFERGIWEIPGPGVISLGGFLGYKSYEYDFFGGSDRWTYTIVGVRGAYHFNGLNVEKLDVYGGVMLSYNILSFSGTSNDFGSRPSATGFVGGRWFFSDSFAAFAEAGYGVAYLTLGVSFRL